jgi:hypothetical protein
VFGIPSWVAIVKPDARQSAGLDLNALRNRHRFFDERIKVGLPIDHCDSPQRQPIGPSPALSLLGGVNTVDKRPANPEAKVVDPVAGGARVAERGAQVIWREVPGTAAVETDFAVARLRSRPNHPSARHRSCCGGNAQNRRLENECQPAKASHRRALLRVPGVPSPRPDWLAGAVGFEP